jgi:hypothetical protein
MSVSTALFLVVSLFPVAGELPKGKLVLMDPYVDAAASYASGTKFDIREASRRVLPRIEKESNGWSWQVKCVANLDKKSLGMTNPDPSLSELGQMARELKADYLVYSTVYRLTGARTGGLSARLSGTASILVSVYDRAEGKLVWREKAEETSTRPGSRGELRARVDQAYVSAFKKALDPFCAKGFRKKLP